MECSLIKEMANQKLPTDYGFTNRGTEKDEVWERWARGDKRCLAIGRVFGKPSSSISWSAVALWQRGSDQHPGGVQSWL